MGELRFATLRRVRPVSRAFGTDRGGLSIDRHYIEQFLAGRGSDIHSHVLEIGDNCYTTAFGGHQVLASDVAHVEEGHEEANLVVDLASGRGLLPEAYDCVILTQTLQFIWHIHAAVRTLHCILKPGGVALVTLPGISQISRYDSERWGEYWRFTNLGAEKLFAEVFGAERVSVKTYGNVLSAAAFLYGLTSDELRPREIDDRDPDYQVILGVRAQKAGADRTG
ncbi:MAG: methyltransferase domain-containing protein [Thermoanaerobaculaceae bacterium]